MDERICPVCGKSFRPRSPAAVYCPPQPGKQRSRCAKRAENAKRGGWDPASRPMPAPFDCEQCYRRCVPGENVAPQATRFCGVRCKKRWHLAHSTAPSYQRIQRKFGPCCRVSSAPVLRSFIEGPCPECGERYVGRGRYCSKRCMRKPLRRARRAKRAGVGYKTLTFRTVAERDGWTCQLCGDPVDPGLTVPHPLAPTMDHMIPLARGGEHTGTNVQLAHFLCNSRKGDGQSAAAVGSQLAMV